MQACCMKMPYETQGEWEGRGYGVEKGEHTENNHERGPEGGGTRINSQVVPSKEESCSSSTKVLKLSARTKFYSSPD